MNFTNLMIAFILAITVVSGLNIYAGNVLTAYNATGDIGLGNYSCNCPTAGTCVCQSNPYITWVTTTSNSLSSVVQKTPDGSLGSLIITGIFWVMGSVQVFLNTISGIGIMAQSLALTASGNNMFAIPGFVFGMISLIIFVAIIGYITFLIIGKGGDNSASV